jgi:hypothetical protein
MPPIFNDTELTAAISLKVLSATSHFTPRDVQKCQLPNSDHSRSRNTSRFFSSLASLATKLPLRLGTISAATVQKQRMATHTTEQ